MTLSRRLRTILIASCIGFAGVETLDHPTIPGFFGLISTAEARVGAPSHR